MLGLKLIHVNKKGLSTSSLTCRKAEAQQRNQNYEGSERTHGGKIGGWYQHSSAIYLREKCRHILIPQ